MRAEGDSHPGRVRPRNEDRFHVDSRRGIFIVVDGVGGHAGGDRAAEIALAALRMRLERDTGTIVERLREAIASANEAIYDESRSRAGLAGMSCVLTAAVVRDGRIFAGHVGDTRLYKLRNGRIVKLTRDHSPVGALEDEGELGEVEAMRHPRRNEVWRDVGTATHRPEDSDFVDVIEETFEPDAACLLCTDGLTDVVGSAAIASAIRSHAGSPALAVRDLIAAANDAGGPDNVTAIVVEGPAFARRGHTSRWRHAVSAARYAVPFAAGAAFAALMILSPLGDALGVSGGPLGPAVQAVQHRTITVDRTGADAFTISAAMAVARPGDTIRVEPGIYRESIVLREGVALVSAQRRAAELRRPPNLPGPWTAITVAGITSGSIRGLRIVGTESDALSVGVHVLDAVASLEDLEVSGAQHSAIQIAGSSAPTVHGSVLHDNRGVGLLIQDSSAPQIVHSAIISNGRDPSAVRAGVEVSGDAEPLMFWNLVAGNGKRGITGLSSAALQEVARQNSFDLAPPQGSVTPRR